MFHNYTSVKEIDFEENEWRHDNQYVITHPDSKHPEVLIDLRKIGLEDGEEVLFQNVV